MSKKVPIIILLITLAGLPAFACSAVFLNKGQTRVIGRTMDWKTGDGEVSINPRQLQKKAIFLQDRSEPAKWTSKYGSVTFDLTFKFSGLTGFFLQFIGMSKVSEPSCGINEAGLYCGSFWLHPPPAVVYPKKDHRKNLNDWQVLSYILDNYATVKEAVAGIKQLRVAGFKEGDLDVDLHWFIADRSGDSAVIEFPDGQMRIHHPAKPPVISNSFYEHSRDYTLDFRGFGGSLPVPVATGEMTSENRFLFASAFLKKAQTARKISPESAFAIMRRVTQTDVRHASTSQALTQWTLAYDLNQRSVTWFTRANPSRRYLELGSIDFSNLSKPSHNNIDL